jgi:hypothetical protein
MATMLPVTTGRFARQHACTYHRADEDFKSDGVTDVQDERTSDVQHRSSLTVSGVSGVADDARREVWGVPSSVITKRSTNAQRENTYSRAQDLCSTTGRDRSEAQPTDHDVAKWFRRRALSDHQDVVWLVINGEVWSNCWIPSRAN